MQQQNRTAVYDVVIAGTGLAGLYAALNLDEGVNALLLSKRELPLSNSALAQGGVASVLDRAHDSRELHIRDTMVAGGFANKPEAVETLVDEGPAAVENLVRLGVDFDRNPDGSLNLTLEGGHSRHRIAHHKDTTGLEIVQKLLAQAQKRPNLTIWEGAALLRLARGENGFTAGIARGGEFLTVASPFFILATGGIGQAYEYTTNSDIATGDGIAFARALGARVSGMKLIQFHPTAFAGGARERFLISESVRGEGAVLLNCRGERFMPGYDPRGELAPRDVVSHFIMEEAARTGSERFTLDITAQNPDFVRRRFPAIYENCLKEGVDITRDRIPVFPCQHYLMGGVEVDTMARTTVPGLYAVGECSRTGVHGNNRLASNSLLEAMVFSRRAALEISEKCRAGAECPAPRALEPEQGMEAPQGVREEIRAILQRSFFVNPDPAAARQGLARVREMQTALAGGYADSPERTELQSLSAVAGMILQEVLE